MKTTSPDHSKISPTAKLVAYFRQFSDIPFTRDVATLIHAEDVLKNFSQGTNLTPEFLKWAALAAEIRYKSIVSAIKKEGITQVLELASGLSFRGLAMTEDPEYIYVETDLPELTEEKQQILSRIISNHGLRERKNLFFDAVNILSFPEIESAIRHFKPNHPVAVIHEGLYHYLSMEEKERAARNIHSVLSRFGGAWITPDFLTNAEHEGRLQTHSELQKIAQGVQGTTQRDVHKTGFDNQQQIVDFFSHLGFRSCISPQIDGSYQLTAMQKLDISEAEFKNYKSLNFNIWTLTVE